jgi:hypothetical protein
MQNPMIHEMIIKVHQAYLLTEVNRARPQRVLTSARPCPREHPLARMGTVLVSLGLRLQERFALAARPHPDECGARPLSRP